MMKSWVSINACNISWYIWSNKAKEPSKMHKTKKHKKRYIKKNNPVYERSYNSEIPLHKCSHDKEEWLYLSSRSHYFLTQTCDLALTLSKITRLTLIFYVLCFALSDIHSNFFTPFPCLLSQLLPFYYHLTFVNSTIM